MSKSQIQVGFILQTKNTTICWTAATISATDGGTLGSAFRIVIIKAHALRKGVIYSGKKRYKTLHLHSSTRNSWRNQWLRPVAQPRNLLWRGSHWRLSNSWKLIQSTSKNLSKMVSGGPWLLRLHSGCDRSNKTAICLACCTSLSDDIFNHQKLFKVVKLTYSKRPPKSHC